jgi:two-component system NarL family response regulator
MILRKKLAPSTVTGQAQLSANVASRLAERMQREELNPRETAVLDLLVKGRSNKEIADAIHLTEAAVSALRHGIVHLE